jgi:hypothetical protein
MDLLAIIAALVPLSGWSLDDPGRVPADVLRLADPLDPLAQSQLWERLRPEIPRGFLVETCLVESGCRAIGVHDVDRHLGASAWRGVWARGRVDRSCPYYLDPATAPASWLEGASTRGAHGLMAAYHVGLLGPCVPLEALDVPFFSAWAAAEKASRLCADLRARGRRCTAERLRCGWARAPLGSRACGRVVRRWRAALARRSS